MTSPTDMKGAITSMRWRSEPQMPEEVTSMMTSVGSWRTGSGTVSTRTSARPCHVTARIVCSPSLGPEIHDFQGLLPRRDLDRPTFNKAVRVPHALYMCSHSAQKHIGTALWPPPQNRR